MIESQFEEEKNQIDSNKFYKKKLFFKFYIDG